jgi:acetylornithine deacetylase/succinyl-diaminopimelate desuccinylase-like protein
VKSFKGAAVESEVVDLVGRLISIKSVNLELKEGSGEGLIGDFIARYLGDLGCVMEKQEVLPGCYNILARLPAPRATRALLLEAHMDTIPIEPMPNGLTPRVSGGRVYGRGACDTKGSLAAMLYALTMLNEVRDELETQPLFLGSVDEEYRARGIHAYVQTQPCLDGAVVGEPTGLAPVIVHKGCLRWNIRTVGRAAHTSRASEGNNAIYQMVEVINRLRSEIESALPTRAHPMAGPPLMTVSVIHGGLQVNVVPDACTIEIDRRLVPGEEPDAVLAEVDALIGRILERHSEFHIVREDPYLVDPPLDTAPDSTTARAALAACCAVLGGGKLSAVGFGSDASKLGRIGVPSIVLGPGSIDQAHSPDEWVAVQELVQAAEIYAEIVRLFGAV